jgi:hypothetical protein
MRKLCEDHFEGQWRKEFKFILEKQKTSLVKSLSCTKDENTQLLIVVFFKKVFKRLFVSKETKH